jgi:hypothetical protein
MTAPGNGILLTVLIVVFAASTGYAAGRIHQWYRTSLERDEAYRDGYDTATRSLFSLAARIVRPRRSEKSAIRGTATVTSNTATVTSILAAPGAATPAGAGKPAPDAGLPVVSGDDSAVRPAWPAGGAEGRHTLPDELVHGPTYRLTPDRIARAKVPPNDLPGEKTRIVSVPKPRAS